MNREIKFRCWDKENKEMYEVQELDFDNMPDGKPAIRPTQFNDYWGMEEMPLMQYTELKDKNGKEIYEGDILRNYGNEIEDWVVSYEYGEFVGTFDNICEDLYELSDFEVIGNIYENPELLEKGE